MQTLIFDFDGMLANTFDATLRITNALAPEFGYRASVLSFARAIWPRAVSCLAVRQARGGTQLRRISQRPIVSTAGH
jgi:hypothetical protein